ncbi:L-seryl-tRNA(Sec) selenium transferase [Frankia sp. Cpl3]|nr:L-seryl-tRNA(Sec) selenium transferase [Frankia sp. Cpl3]
MIADPGRPSVEPTRFLTLPATPSRVITARAVPGDPTAGRLAPSEPTPNRPRPTEQTGLTGRPAGRSSVLPGTAPAHPSGSVPGAALATAGQIPARLRPVINATGILLHDGLGRAPLSPAARAAVDAAAATCDLELDLATGRRGRRGSAALTALAATVPAARSVHVVNNNAGALMLAALALAGGREIVVSRGEIVETADGFRLPELLMSTGARLREVGTTNRTTLGDYADAIGPRTGFVLRMHPPSFQMVGLTAAPVLTDLAELCARRGVPLIGDPGSGLLTPDQALPGEPDASTWLRDGVSLVTTCGDKLLGGPQCGLVLGRADLVDRMRRHPMARALRVDKLTLAALEATLRFGDSPVRHFLHADAAALRSRAERLASWLRGSGVPASAVSSRAVVSSDGVDDASRSPSAARRATAGTGTGLGGHGAGLPSAAVALDAGLAALLRQGRPSVLGRVEQGCCLLDLRSVPPDLDPVLAATVLAAATGAGSGAGDSPAAPPEPTGTPDDPDGPDGPGATGTEPTGWAHAPGWARPTDRSPSAGWTPADVDEVTLQ